MIFSKVLPASSMLLASLTSAQEVRPTNPLGLPADQWDAWVSNWVNNIDPNERVEACLYSCNKGQQKMNDQIDSLDVAGQRKTLSKEMSKFPEYDKLILYAQISEKENELKRLHDKLRELEGDKAPSSSPTRSPERDATLKSTEVPPTPLGNIIQLILAFAPAEQPQLKVSSSEPKVVDIAQKRVMLFDSLWNRDGKDFSRKVRYVAERAVRIEVIDKLLEYQKDHRDVTKQLQDNVDVNGKAYLRELFAGGTWQDVYRRVGFPIYDVLKTYKLDQINIRRAELDKLEANQEVLKVYDGLKQLDQERMNDLLHIRVCFESSMKFLENAQAYSERKSA